MPKGETRFNADAWVQVWIKESDISFDFKCREIIQSDSPDEEKIALLKDRACELAQTHIDALNEMNPDIEINTESFSADDFGTIDWHKLIHPEAEDEDV